MTQASSSSSKRTVTVIPGDGIGPECVLSAVQLIEASGAKVSWEERHAGASVFKKGVASGVPEETIDSIRRTRLVLKGPLETPVGFGEKSANVTLRKLFETYGNIRPVRELPGVATPFSGRGIDLVVVRENVEDLYAGIEHMQTPGVAQCLKLISRKGCEKIARLAFEFARSEGRKKVACATKANIMKMTEGLLKRTFETVAKDYPDIESSHIIIDNCAHQLVRNPQNFDVIVTTNMNGDILSDLTSGLVGGLGFAPSANLGSEVAIFEAVHGSAPKYAGKNVINPTAVVMSGVMMLRYMGEFEAAALIENAVVKTFEDGIRTRDVSGDAGATSTTDFTKAVIKNFGKKPSTTWKIRDYKPVNMPKVSANPAFVTAKSRRVLGADVFIESGLLPAAIGPVLEKAVAESPFRLKMISNRGTQVFPETGAMTDCVDQYRCRFVLRDAAASASDREVVDLIGRVSAQYGWTHVEKLNEFDGEIGFTKAQGEN